MNFEPMPITDENSNIRKCCPDECSNIQHDPFYFCSISGCEAVREGCHKTCPDGLVNKTKADTVRKMRERLKKAFNFGHTILEKSICDIIDQTAKEMLEGMMDDS